MSETDKKNIEKILLNFSKLIDKKREFIRRNNLSIEGMDKDKWTEQYLWRIFLENPHDVLTCSQLCLFKENAGRLYDKAFSLETSLAKYEEILRRYYLRLDRMTQ